MNHMDRIAFLLLAALNGEQTVEPPAVERHRERKPRAKPDDATRKKAA